ncbi:flagellar motor protein MotB [Parafrankia soli]|uniref:Flagellar motor protein MotB n=1 Tax=Parafrankia soli TaxID=2599596 RepID=A0A1S1QBF1_9ACTN|nr:OmpA family protein [Parafrankia soli]OHV32168.1 flagellar motor protein MotB [Parafrankia soli]
MSSPAVAFPRRPRLVAFAVSLIIAWLLLGLGALWLRRGPIENDLTGRAADAVRSAGATQVRVSAEGREIVLHGRFDSAEDARRAAAAAAVSGSSSVRLAADAVIASEPAQPLVVGMEQRAGRAPAGVVLSATVPDSATRAALLGAAADAAGGVVSATVTVDPRVATPAVEAFGDVARALGTGPGVRSVTIDGSSVVLWGSAPDDAARASIGAAVLAAARQSIPGASLENRLAVGSGATVALDPATGEILRPAAPTPATVPAPSAVPAPAPAPGTTGGAGWAAAGSADSTRAALRAALDGTALTFPVGDTVLGASTRSGLDKVARALLPGDLTVIVGGHTDSTGPRALNQALSIDRARVAREYLVMRGVPAERIRAAGFGPDQPIADNASTSGRAANRRVDVTPVAD